MNGWHSYQSILRRIQMPPYSAILRTYWVTLVLLLMKAMWCVQRFDCIRFRYTLL